MKTKVPACVMTNGNRSTAGRGAGRVTFRVGNGVGFATDGEPADSGVDVPFGPGDASGVTGTGGSTVGRNVSSLGANLSASSLVGNSIATKTLGRSVRVGQVANIRREDANASEFFFRKSMIDWNSFPGSASLMIGSTISPAPPLPNNCPTLRTSPYILKASTASRSSKVISLSCALVCDAAVAGCWARLGAANNINDSETERMGLIRRRR